jgi:hypothetical protein
MVIIRTLKLSSSVDWMGNRSKQISKSLMKYNQITFSESNWGSAISRLRYIDKLVMVIYSRS